MRLRDLKPVRAILDLPSVQKVRLRLKRDPLALPPRSLSFEFTNSCNLRCSYCPKSLGVVERPYGRLDPDGLARMLDNLGNLSVLQADLVGFGEMFLNPDWAELLDMVRTRLVGSHFSMATNGVLLDEDKLLRINERPNTHLTISVNASSRERYEQINNADRFELVMANVERVVARYRKCPRHNISISIQLLDTLNTAEEIAAFQHRYGHLAGNRVGLTVHPYSNWGGLFTPQRNAVRWPCSHLYVPGISWSGDVYACCVAFPQGDPEMLLGNLKEQPIQALYNSEKFMALHRANMNGQLHSVARLCATCNSWSRIPNVFFKNPLGLGRAWL